jgi:LCP family protein required for cell wall assembly
MSRRAAPRHGDRRRVATALALALALAGLAALTVPGLLPGSGADAQPTTTGDPAVVVSKVANGSAGPEQDGRLAFLVIGSDSGAPKFGRGGTAAGGRADSIHLVVVDPRARRGVVVGFPRDSYVAIPGHGSGKINAAMVYGGPSLLVRTVEQFSGIGIDYYALTSFDGLTDLVNAIGGVHVNVRRAVHDDVAGANIRAGRQKLSGPRALAFARARKSVPGGDFARSEHQGQILVGGLATFQHQLKDDPTTLMRWLAATRREVKLDMPFTEQLRLALVARRIPPRNLQNVVLPGGGGTAGGASIVRLAPGARRLLADARDGRLGN